MTNWLYDAFFHPHLASKRPFLISPTGEVTSYEAFLKLAAQMANALVHAGVQPGDRVVVQVEKSEAALALYVASVEAGAIFLPLNTAYTPAEVQYFLIDAEPSLVVCDPAARAPIADAATKVGARLETLAIDGSGSFRDLARLERAHFEPIPRSAPDAAALLYTSGTTGRSKGALLSHDNLVSNARALSNIWHFTEEDVLLHALPIFHVHGLFVATNVAMASGAAMIFLPRFDANEVIRHLPAASTMMGVPTFYTRLLANAGFTREVADHVRLFISGSAPLLPGTFAAFEALTGKRILERYGMTETGMITSNPYSGERRAGSVGFALPGVKVRISDPDTGAPVPGGATGVIEVSGANVFAGYWKRPELRQTEFRKDGYFITGDLGFLDSSDYLSIVGRAKDLIISGGLNIYPKEIETVIDGLPGVVESAVFGLPHTDLGEAVAAAIVAEKGAKLDPDVVKGALSGVLASFKRPRAIYILEDLPRNAMGKVQKNVLREQYRETFA